MGNVERPDDTGIINGISSFVKQLDPSYEVTHWIAACEVVDLNTGEQVTVHGASQHSSPSTVTGLVVNLHDRVRQPVWLFEDDEDDGDDGVSEVSV